MVRYSAWLIILVAGATSVRLRTPTQLRHTPPVCCCPPLRDAERFARGSIPLNDGLQAWWRQDPEHVQVIVEMPEDASFRRDVAIDVSRKKIDLAVCKQPVLIGDLAHEVAAADSEWLVEDDVDGFDGDRYLVVALKKLESFVDWPAPLRDGSSSSATVAKRLLIGGSGEAQKVATAQQLSAYQALQKLPAVPRGDVYARVPPTDGAPSEELYFVGKVIAEAAAPEASLAAQVVLVKEHARRYQPSIFGECADEEISLWLAPGNTEMRVAQNEVDLTEWSMPVDDVELPAAGACGFEPETAPPPHMGGDPFRCRRDMAGKPISAAFQANVVKPDEVPGAYNKWLEDQ